jgi:hypothetical protein
MGKQYTTDTLGLEGEEIFDEKSSIISRRSSILSRKAKSENFEDKPMVFAFTQNYFRTEDIEPLEYNIISIGGGRDETSEVINLNQNDTNFIRFFTKEQIADGRIAVGVERFTIKPTGILNISKVPAFRDQTEAVEEGGLVNGDIYQDGEQNLKIVFGVVARG